MESNSEFTGTHRIILPEGYMDSIEFAVELYQDQIADVAANLDVDNLEVSRTNKVLGFSVAAVAIWLLPASWMTCL